jgi:hypothetical protein
MLSMCIYIHYTQSVPGDSVPTGVRFSVPSQEAHSASCLSFGGGGRVKLLGNRPDHSPPCSAMVENSLGLYFCLHSVPAQACHGMTFTYTQSVHSRMCI